MSLLELHPSTGEKRPLRGLYLDQGLFHQSTDVKRPFLFTNYITSLDGRIAIPHHSKPGMKVPESTANARDWRLFQELRAQADLLITSGRYLRDISDGRAQENLAIYDDPEFADLGRWRQAQAMPLEPDLAVLSASLNFDIPPKTVQDGRRLWVFTTENADPERVRELERGGATVLRSGPARVDGQLLVQHLADAGYQSVFATAGPKVLHTLLSAGQLDRLYLTFAHRLLAGDPFSSILEGPLLASALDFELHSLFLDAETPGAGGQLFARYDRLIAAG